MSTAKLKVDENGMGYYSVAKSKVAYSEEIEHDVIADFDAAGGLIGLELLDAKRDASRLQELLAKAAAKSRGAFEKQEVSLPRAG